MADIGLPGDIPNDVYTTQVTSGIITFMSSNQTLNPISVINGTILLNCSYNYVFKCPSANSGIRNSQMVWF